MSTIAIGGRVRAAVRKNWRAAIARPNERCRHTDGLKGRRVIGRRWANEGRAIEHGLGDDICNVAPAFRGNLGERLEFHLELRLEFRLELRLKLPLESGLELALELPLEFSVKSVLELELELRRELGLELNTLDSSLRSPAPESTFVGPKG